MSEESATKCSDCESWWPYLFVRSYGVCRNSKCKYHKRVIHGSRLPCKFFETRTLELTSQEHFFWCESCSEFFHSSIMGLHSGHKVFKGIVDNEA